MLCNHAVPLLVLYVNKRYTNARHLVITQNAIMRNNFPSDTSLLTLQMSMMSRLVM